MYCYSLAVGGVVAAGREATVFSGVTAGYSSSFISEYGEIIDTLYIHAFMQLSITVNSMLLL